MAELLGIVSAASGAVSLAVKIHHQLLDLATGSDRTEIHEFSNEVGSCVAVLKALTIFLEQNDSVTERDALKSELELAHGTLTAASNVVARYENYRRQRGTGGRVKNLALRLKWSQDRENADKIKGDLRARTTNLGLLLNLGQMASKTDIQKDDAEIIIAVLGPTGAGKSRFIREATGSSEVIVGDTLTSTTETVRAHSITIDGRLVTLVDTPGFDDTYRGDAEILSEVAEWLAVSYQSAKRLTGLVFIQPINMARITATMLKNLKVFEKLVGIENLSNVVLVTSKWDQLQSIDVGIRREEELKHEFWAPLIEKGSRTARFSGDRTSALKTIGLIALENRLSLNPPLVIQTELVDEHKTLGETDAGRALRQEMSEMQRKYELQLAQIKEEAGSQVSRVREAAEEEAKRFQNELESIRVEQNLLRNALASKEHMKQVEARIQTDWDQRIESLQNLEAHIEGKNIRDAPPPYEVHPTHSKGYGRPVLVEWSIWAQGELRRLLRPKLEEGRTRLEWICSCGDILYGDFTEGSPGSLKELAGELGAAILAGPSSPNNSMSGSTSSAPTVPLPAHTRGTVGSASQTGGSASSSGASTSGFSPPQLSLGGSIRNRDSSSGNLAKKYLEVCMYWKSQGGFRKLAEIDVASASNSNGPLSDKVVFDKIWQQYSKDRTVVTMFGKWAVHRPHHGNFVMFLTDIMPKVAVMPEGPPVPPLEEVESGRYEFDNKIAGPPIPPHLFIHFLTKETPAHTEAIWTKRFPQKLKDSVFYGAKPLDKEWGIEIVETRNWLLLCILQLSGLLLSGALAAVYAVVTGDRASGIAIGSWCSAVQGLVVAILFFRWA